MYTIPWHGCSLVLLLLPLWNFVLTDMCYCAMVLSYSLYGIFKKRFYLFARCYHTMYTAYTVHTHTHCASDFSQLAVFILTNKEPASQPTIWIAVFFILLPTSARVCVYRYFLAYRSPFSYIKCAVAGFIPLPKTIFICAHFIGPLHFEVAVVSSYNNITWFYPHHPHSHFASNSFMIISMGHMGAFRSKNFHTLIGNTMRAIETQTMQNTGRPYCCGKFK